ncbi:MAG: type I 3-dehydroquinate dehydratase [Lachnospiraceae bacterium]|nr:type I 3-dehydroquinate dehydratase [Lachnospiraceae bacterium]
MKSLFNEKPLLTVMVQTPEADAAIDTIRKAIPSGAEAFGLQTCRLKPEYCNEDTYRRIFAETRERPVYVTNYRYGYNTETGDDVLAEGLLTLARSGASLVDVMGDLYDRHPEELTTDPVAVDKQKKLIDQIHDAGAQVLMSSHVYHFIPAERVLEMALTQQERGVDVVKIVTGADSMEQQIENLKITNMLKQELKVPFLFLSAGQSRLHRLVGPALGSCMYLCVYEHDELSTKAQPLLAHAKAVRDNIIIEG